MPSDEWGQAMMHTREVKRGYAPITAFGENSPYIIPNARLLASVAHAAKDNARQYAGQMITFSL